MTTPSHTEPEENNLPDETSDVGQEEVEDQAMQEEIAKPEEMEAIAATGDVFSDSDVFNILCIQYIVDWHRRAHSGI